MSDPDDHAWFAPKRFGYGAGMPIAWQGWALVAGYFVILGAGMLMIEWDRQAGMVGAIALFVPATIALLAIAALKTRGGWRWRWGKDD